MNTVHGGLDSAYFASLSFFTELLDYFTHWQRARYSLPSSGCGVFLTRGLI